MLSQVIGQAEQPAAPSLSGPVARTTRRITTQRAGGPDRRSGGRQATKLVVLLSDDGGYSDLTYHCPQTTIRLVIWVVSGQRAVRFGWCFVRA